MALPQYKESFLKDCVSAGALKFGTFTLKSKRISPYFFNAGLFHRADLLRSISSAYAHTLRMRWVSTVPAMIDFRNRSLCKRRLAL